MPSMESALELDAVSSEDAPAPLPAFSAAATGAMAAAAGGGGGAALDRMVAMGRADLMARMRSCCFDCRMER